jgi:hypothetical protein
MSNFKQDILQSLAENKETAEDIQAIRILSELDSYSYGDPEPRNSPYLVAGETHCHDTTRILNLLDYEYDSGFGSIDCHDIIIWTPETVYFIHEYDGATSLTYLPRNPS